MFVILVVINSELNMKQLTAFLFLIFSINSFAQFSFGPAIYFGKSSFPNDQQTVRSETRNFESRNNYALGVFGEYKFTNWFAAQIDVMYDQLNSEEFYFVDETDPTAYYSATLDRIEYLTLPLTAQFSYKRLKLNAGYQPAFLLSNYTNTNRNGINESWRGGKFKEMNSSFILGFSFDVVKDIHIEARYLRGISNIINPDNALYYEARTSQILIGLYYDIRLKKNEAEK